MSFILDALKKSERERKRAEVPDPLAVQEPLLPAKKSRPVHSSHIIMVSILLSTLAAGIWFGIWYGKNREFQGIENNEAPQSIQLPVVPNDTDERINEKQHALVRESDTMKPAGAIANRPEQRKNDVHFVRKGEDKPFNPAAVSQAGAISLPVAEIEIPPPDKNRLYSLQELPAAVREKLPHFSFSVFLYTDEPSARRIRVNGVMMKEGQYVTDGLKLEEIIADGAIFSYMNYRFHVAMP